MAPSTSSQHGSQSSPAQDTILPTKRSLRSKGSNSGLGGIGSSEGGGGDGADKDGGGKVISEGGGDTRGKFLPFGIGIG